MSLWGLFVLKIFFSLLHSRLWSVFKCMYFILCLHIFVLNNVQYPKKQNVIGRSTDYCIYTKVTGMAFRYLMSRGRPIPPRQPKPLIMNTALNFGPIQMAICQMRQEICFMPMAITGNASLSFLPKTL